MDEKRVLIVEDDHASLSMMKDLLQFEGYLVTAVENGKEAVEEFKKDPFLVVITDIEMPIMDGNELITQLKKFPMPPIIIVETIHEESSYIIDIMKKGVFDYLVKPIDMDKLLIKVDKAFEIAEVKRTQYIMEKEKVIRLENHLEWYRWEERLKTGDSDRVDKSLFYNLQTSFNRGTGFGTLVSIANLIKSFAKKQGEDYLVKGELIDLLDENAHMAEKALKVFSELNVLITENIELETITYKELWQYVKQVIDSFENSQKIKNQRILLNDPKEAHGNIHMKISVKYAARGLQELLLNACKFSEAESTIIVLLEVLDEELSLSVINNATTDEDERWGIPMEYENIIFEPFYRLTKKVFDEFNTLDFGLGLTEVENIVKKHNGKITVHNIKDYSDLAKGFEIKVNARITIPLVKDE
ncbi:MAG: response regulator [bacterium]|nr:response regulator [bacterium]